MDGMKQDMAMLQKLHVVGVRRSTSSTAHAHPSIDACIQALIDARLAPFEDRLQSFTYRFDSVYYPLRDSVDFLTTRLDALHQEIYMIQRQLDSQAEPSPSIDRRTRPSIDGDYAALRSKLVTEKSLQDKLDEITFSQNLRKKDVYQELKDISESTYVRLGMQQRSSIGNLQHRMHAKNSLHESFAVDTKLPEMKSDEYDEDYHREKDIEYRGLAIDDRGLLHTSFASATSTAIDSNIKPLIDDHPTPNLEVQVKDNTYYRYLILDEFGIFRDPERQARAMDGHILNISKEGIAEIIAMNGCCNFFISKNRPEALPSIDDAA
ncbi:hypothetical protein F2Q69_00059561 [Brassica cretica]|uniref:Uncharacterized protein n=1 Tax=Brassica cretica TaxID=69181 RepID=A0A8S9RCP1_BRACR|nr:hypothetical protein F2Q69_00059561 [Brassica cretica]